VTERGTRASIVVFDGLNLDPASELAQVIPGNPADGGRTVECGTTVLSESADGRTVTGLWRCEPCDWMPMDMGDRAEFFHVLEGSMILREADGEPIEALPGMTVFSPPGWVGTWRVPSRLRKVFVSFQP
jgi:uncharacterized cupin superfamily protein